MFPQNNPPPSKTGYETFIENGGGNSIPKPVNSLTSLMNPAYDSSFSRIKTLADLRATADLRQTEIIPPPRENDPRSFYEKSTAELTRVGAVMGTPLYMSPEQCRAERLGTGSDIYSLGVIAYEMLSGKTPFEGEYPSVIAGHLPFAPPPLKARKVPREVKRVVHAALSKDALNRPPSAEVFSSQLRSRGGKHRRRFPPRARHLHRKLFQIDLVQPAALSPDHSAGGGDVFYQHSKILRLLESEFRGVAGNRFFESAQTFQHRRRGRRRDADRGRGGVDRRAIH